MAIRTSSLSLFITYHLFLFVLRENDRIASPYAKIGNHGNDLNGGCHAGSLTSMFEKPSFRSNTLWPTWIPLHFAFPVTDRSYSSCHSRRSAVSLLPSRHST